MRRSTLLFLLACAVAALALVSASDEFDSDEFEDFEVAGGADAAAAVAADDDTVAADLATEDDADDAAAGDAGASPPNTQPLKPGKATEPKTYELEIAAGVLVVAYIINFFIGKSANQKLAKSWAETYRGLFESQFSKFGIGADTGLLKMESYSNFKFFASGRRNCSGLLAELDLQKRHDLVSIATSFFVPSYDTLIVDIPMKEAAMEPFVFAILRSKERKQLHAAARDLSDYAKTVKSDVPLPKEFEVVTDCRELVRDFLHPAVVKTITAAGKKFRMMHFTDQAPLSNIGVGTKCALRFKFLLPSASKMEDIKALMEMCVQFIDVVADASISKEAKRKATAARKLFDDRVKKSKKEQMLERSQELRMAKLKREQEALEALPRDKQKKLEAKKHKREMKKSGQSKVRLKMM